MVVLSVAILAVFAMLFSGEFADWNGTLCAVLAALFAVVFVPLIAYCVYVSIASSRAYKTEAKIEIVPPADGAGGRVLLNVYNFGDGALCMAAAGFLDRQYRTVSRGGKTRRTLVDVPVYSDLSRLPLRLERGCVETLELPVDPSVFKRCFSGVFYEIDTKESEQNNRFSRLLASADVEINGVPAGRLRRSVVDGSLQKIFVGKIRRDKAAFWGTAVFMFLWLAFVAFIVLNFSG